MIPVAPNFEQRYFMISVKFFAPLSFDAMRDSSLKLKCQTLRILQRVEYNVHFFI